MTHAPDDERLREAWAITSPTTTEATLYDHTPRGLGFVVRVLATFAMQLLTAFVGWGLTWYLPVFALAACGAGWSGVLAAAAALFGLAFLAACYRAFTYTVFRAVTVPTKWLTYDEKMAIVDGKVVHVDAIGLEVCKLPPGSPEIAR